MEPIQQPTKHRSRFSRSLQNISRQQSIDTGMAITLLFLLASIFSSLTNAFAIAALVALLVAMTAPMLLKPFAVLWFGFANHFGKFMSSILLSIIYGAVVLPIGWCRQKLGKDSMQLNAFTKENVSFFHDRQHDYEKKDLLHPY